MKKISLAITILTIGIITVRAQELKPNAVIKAKTGSFVTRKTISANLLVFNSKNAYIDKTPKNRNPDVTYERTDKSGLLNAFSKVFSTGRLTQLLPERYMQMTLYVSPSGQVSEISFLLNNNTLVSAQELEDLEKAIKANVSFKFRPQDIKGQDFIDINWIVNYKKVLDKTIQ